jgi:hypothetical protein
MTDSAKQAPVASHGDIIRLWPTLRDFAADLAVSYGAAKKMRRRNSINPRRWPRVIEAASGRGLPVDLDVLSRTAPSGQAVLRAVAA